MATAHEHSSNRHTPADASPASSAPSPLTIFAFIWACQALVHQDFYSAWMKEGDLRGWVVTILAIGTLLRPSSIPMFAGMLLSSIVYNVAKWPFVVNHILVETIINATVLAAIGLTFFRRRNSLSLDDGFREDVFRRFSPVLCGVLVLLYWFAYIAKLNTGFINADVSCVVAMYSDMLRRFPFLPDNVMAHRATIVMVLVIELVIPLCLTFRRTRWIAILIGLPFHVILGLLGHRTFSAFAFALYVLLCMDGIRPVLGICNHWLRQRTSERSRGIAYSVACSVVVATIGSLIVLELGGHFRTKIAGIGIYQVPWLIWLGWSFLVSTACAAGIYWSMYRRDPEAHAARPTTGPGLLWGTIPLVVLMGLSQYIGLKTETCFTMYSNLRTEGDWNNHLFMPAIRLGSWQDDLVNIVSTDHAELQAYVEHNDLITFFELRRVVSATSCDVPFYLDYERAGESQYLAYADHKLTQSEPWGQHSELLGKLLYFRPVPTDACVPCRH